MKVLFGSALCAEEEASFVLSNEEKTALKRKSSACTQGRSEACPVLLQCSTSCGLGAVWRTLSCSSGSDPDCDPAQRPPPAQRCYLRPCASWRLQEWSKVRRADFISVIFIESSLTSTHASEQHVCGGDSLVCARLCTFYFSSFASVEREDHKRTRSQLILLAATTPAQRSWLRLGD